MPNVRFTVTGPTGKTDGYLDMVLGALFLSGTLRHKHLSKITHDNGTITLIADCVVNPPPLGHVGEDDIPEAGENG